MQDPIPVVDLFAGPGGLGEGFSSLEVGIDGRMRYPFRVALSVEKEASAHKTLRLRSYFRLLLQSGVSTDCYYDYVSGRAESPYTKASQHLWEQAASEALRLELGTDTARRTLYSKVRQIADRSPHWVLIGGPPCQAYSLVGRARNKGVRGYKAEHDDRHFLYVHYLDLIRQFRPSVFVMENVKGILSASVAGTRIFAKILDDLHGAGSKDGAEYKIYSLSRSGAVYAGPLGGSIEPQDFVVRSELYGVPQARHRVILVGVRNDVAPRRFHALGTKQKISVREAIADLPRLRSGLSESDSQEAWHLAVKAAAKRAIEALGELDDSRDRRRMRAVLTPLAKGKLPYRSRGGLRTEGAVARASTIGRRLRDPRLRVVLNHETRGHMPEDFARYLFAAAYGRVKKASPSKVCFPRSLAPNHASWFSGGFADRFRVQLGEQPSTTVTCHIAKDGHYYIHYDVRQCRSLTVREAARLQTFPDNYFFEGNRTQQYTQVGNAVPPLLARQIARAVWKLLR